MVKFRASLVISGMPHVAAAYCASNRTVQDSRNRLIWLLVSKTELEAKLKGLLYLDATDSWEMYP